MQTRARRKDNCVHKNCEASIYRRHEPSGVPQELRQRSSNGCSSAWMKWSSL